MIVSDYELAVLSAEAYSDRPQKLPGWELATVRDASTDTDALLARSKTGELVVAVRGTDTWADILRHLSPWRKLDGCQPRWRESAEALADIIAGAVQAADTVYLTGHSLGGAVADILPCLLYDGLHQQHVVTFGAPPAGDGGHAVDVQYCTDSYRRYVIGGGWRADKITRWAILWALGYRHPVPPTSLPDPDWWPYNNHSAGGYVAAMRAHNAE